jgi:hypothetical protein
MSEDKVWLQQRRRGHSALRAIISALDQPDLDGAGGQAVRGAGAAARMRGQERGNPGNLRAAARRKHEHAVNRAEQAIRALVRAQDPVSFRAVARLAECSPDFLYRTPQLRSRIEALRA